MIIGITGQKNAGKDTIGDYLVENYGFTKMSFAEPLKMAAAILLNTDLESIERWKNENKNVCVVPGAMPDGKNEVTITVPLVTANYPITVRHFLQRMGTEVGRGLFGKDFWVHQLARKIDVTRGANTVICDVRFQNEADAVDHWSGHLWRVIRPGTEGDLHKSEIEQNDIKVHFEINNNGEIHTLYEAIDELMEDEYGFPHKA
jgi:hypothetical protein